MNIALSKLIPFCLIIVLLGCLHASDNKLDLISKAKTKHEYFGEFLNENNLNEKEIVIVLNFMENPEKFFDKIKMNKINPNKTFMIFDRLGITDKEFFKYSYEYFLNDQFSINKNTERKIEIITFLMCQADGYLGEILSGYYTNLFGVKSEKFIKYLSALSENEWEKVASGASLNWEAFKSAVAKLGDEGFEGKLKRYVLFEQFFNLSTSVKDIVTPKGWQLPDAKDFQDTWRTEDRDKYIKISGDFNGDHILDIAMIFVSEDRYSIGLFAFLGQKNGEYKIYQLCEISGLKDELKMGIRLVKPGSYKTAYGKGYFDRDRLEDEPDILVLEKDAIDFFEFESANSFFYWDVVKNNFVRVWMSD